MTQPNRIHIFQAYGVELEYMIVDSETLKVKSIADELLKSVLGEYGSDYENGIVTWSNELVCHVIELKSTRPELNFTALNNAFADNVNKINHLLSQHNAMLLPGAAHPFMQPERDTKLWPHDNNEVYALYNKIFDCSGHGWSNLQSTHINLPFYDDEEFAKLHAAVRLIMPVLPALAASSPIIEAKYTGMLDTRLMYYKSNQAKIPCITGKVIPEAVFSKRTYLNTIYDKIKTEIAPYDPEKILDPIWVNSRGAIPRFDRGSIEIRILDVQECPAADLAILSLVIETIKALAKAKFIDLESQMKWKTEHLASIYEACIIHAENAIIDNQEYLHVFGVKQASITAGALWKHIYNLLISSNPTIESWKAELNVILQEGTLASRIKKVLGESADHESIKVVYKRLADCLHQNKLFIP
ncbi:MAG TPA: glutamate-cysteine ligase family protein [Cyclobacteriaceae bacterium]|nr:glutamate-cysteine ligase family protein [Cyclobacteriaceae bacterium]